MNNMKSKEKVPKSNTRLKKLSLSIGNFIRYWGFRRIHGAIWTQLYLSKTPLSCTDLAQALGLSKALVSPALEELCSYKLISEAPAPNEKTKVYAAAENFNEVIQHVLKIREAQLMKEITKDYSAFLEKEAVAESFSEKRVKTLGEMILSANLMLEIMRSQKNILDLSKDIQRSSL